MNCVLFCQIIADPCMVSGGWLLVSNIVIDESLATPVLSVETTYHGITSYQNNKTVLSKNAMNELKTHMTFTQLRFHCSKRQGRTFHVTTVTNSTGEAVVQYFSGQTDVQPGACGSFVKMDNDDSLMSGVCHLWGFEGGAYNVGKWGHDGNDQKRLYEHPAFVGSMYHWIASVSMCDDWISDVSIGDFWKVYVR